MKKIDCPGFILGEKLTQEQLDFFDTNGVIIFRNFIPKETVKLFISETERIEKQLLDEGKEKINGVPLKFGKDEKGNKNYPAFVFPFIIKQAAARHAGRSPHTGAY